MFCTQCGVELEPQDRYCCQCGRGTGVGSPWQRKGSERQLTLSSREKKIGGVCAGLARYFDMDVTLMRIVWLVFIFAPPGAGLIAYPLAWLVMPREQEQASATAEPSPASR